MQSGIKTTYCKRGFGGTVKTTEGKKKRREISPTSNTQALADHCSLQTVCHPALPLSLLITCGKKQRNS